ncbi:uncharacterized protein M421DRAFT_59020 [Didymella exigua CBS 183.55]|uniref:Calcineurin-like phosphoesterase domain-containing protein n=1 Tax=Didymella exigua CBS 183.55 TaxID=1150837 RepID=A0A6A5RS78_9PLEO|nr:uncharacterized protein M421DRAFT_59020 [Didymella exigua CBS 183.55]KAF1930622.1 hypothetical protein M421DRAFT_59020 [Didymella exigua CBS 183.55]
MQLSRLLFGLSALLLPVALLGTTWLYLYPLFHGCAFPLPRDTSLPLLDARAPFRLLALGDPQLEGDSSLPDPDAPLFPSLANAVEQLRDAGRSPRDVLHILRDAARRALTDGAAALEGLRKTVDLWGNDWYLAHIVRSLRWWTEPTHVAVLGDLLGSQWITDGEFEKRAGRYWGRVMRGLERVPDAVMGVDGADDSHHYDEPEYERQRSWGGRREVLGADDAWARRVLNIAGNHDIGYAGDIDEARVDRFERAFGSVNWDVWFELPGSTSSTSSTSTRGTPTDDTPTDDTPTNDPPALRLVVLNTMNLDTPAYTDSLQQDTYAFLNHLISTSRPVGDKTHATILLTHIPLHKEAGICTDAPHFAYFDAGHGVREQNMLSEHGSAVVLESLFGLSSDTRAEGAGLGRRGVVINGHDHAGCDTLHWIRQPGAPACEEEMVQSGDAFAFAYSPAEIVRAEPDAGGGAEPDAGGGAEPDAGGGAEAEPHPSWRATRFPPLDSHHHNNRDTTCPPTASPHLREITLRSMMGDFSGYAGFLSAWFDAERGDAGEWVIEFSTCGAGVQHWWWGVHGVDLVVVLAAVGGVVAWVCEGTGGRLRKKEGKGDERRESAQTKRL